MEVMVGELHSLKQDLSSHGLLRCLLPQIPSVINFYQSLGLGAARSPCHTSAVPVRCFEDRTTYSAGALTCADGIF